MSVAKKKAIKKRAKGRKARPGKKPPPGSGPVPFVRVKFDNDSDDLAGAESYASATGQPWHPAASQPAVAPHTFNDAPVGGIENVNLISIQLSCGGQFLSFCDRELPWAVMDVQMSFTGFGVHWLLHVDYFGSKPEEHQHVVFDQSGPLS